MARNLSDKLAKDCRAVMASRFYQQTFPTRLVQSSVQELANGVSGFRLATSIGGVLTGRGGDLIIIDDPLKPGEAVVPEVLLADPAGVIDQKGHRARIAYSAGQAISARRPIILSLTT
jgi:hypothetical protein